MVTVGRVVQQGEWERSGKEEWERGVGKRSGKEEWERGHSTFLSKK
jgi:hypothetical protein